jgi:hypothetical protein
MQNVLARLAYCAFVFAVVLWIASVAHADTFYFSYTAPSGVSGSGTLVGTSEGVINGSEA